MNTSEHLAEYFKPRQPRLDLNHALYSMTQILIHSGLPRDTGQVNLGSDTFKMVSNDLFLKSILMSFAVGKFKQCVRN